MRETVLRCIRSHNMLKPGDRVLVAVSGGADSVALLRILLELRCDLGIVVAVAHYHHGLRGDAADADEHFVAELTRYLDLQLYVARGDVQAHAANANLTLEAAGRQQRYAWLTETALDNRFDIVATGHTSDDQAETVLLKFLRGAGTQGLAGVYPVLDRGGIRFVRPLLDTSRAELERYLTEIGQSWREDESNLDQRFRRNRVRYELLPLLERDYNPDIRQSLKETAEIARAEQSYWDFILEPLIGKSREPSRLRLDVLANAEVALQRRLLKRFLEVEGVAPTFQHIENLRRCALGDSSGCELPGGWSARVDGEHLVIAKPQAPAAASDGYELTLPIPGEASANATSIRALPVPADFAAEQSPGTLLRADLIGSMLTIRNWLPGDRFHPAHSRSPEKLKRLFAEKHIPAGERASWPVALKGDEIVWVSGFPVASGYEWRPGDGNAIRIEAIPIGPPISSRQESPAIPDLNQLREFAVRYTTAWCSQDPMAVAACYAPEGSLTINKGAPSKGRPAITDAARSFMTAFPDLQVIMDDLRIVNGQPQYHWTLMGTNTAPGGTGRKVIISGFEAWQMGPDALIASSEGHFDAAEYDRQLYGG